MLRGPRNSRYGEGGAYRPPGHSEPEKKSQGIIGWFLGKDSGAGAPPPEIMKTSANWDESATEIDDDGVVAGLAEVWNEGTVINVDQGNPTPPLGHDSSSLDEA